MPATKRNTRCRMNFSLFLLVLLSAGVPAMAQDIKPDAQAILIDGAVEPDRIPEWMLWRELFNGALMLSEKDPNAGRDFWESRFGFSSAQIAHLLAQGRALREAEAKINADIRKAGQSKGSPQAAIRSQVHQLQADKESRVLEFRDVLRNRIGVDAYQKLSSYIRINVAPNIKVLRDSSDGK